MNIIEVALLTVCVAVIYLLPTLIAINRGHKNAVVIGVMNVCLGFTGLFWFIAFLWSLTGIKIGSNSTKEAHV